MTLTPLLLPASAVELRDDDGALVATIYARASSIEIVAAGSVALDSTIDMTTRSQRVSVNINKVADQEARRR